MALGVPGTLLGLPPPARLCYAPGREVVVLRPGYRGSRLGQPGPAWIWPLQEAPQGSI